MYGRNLLDASRVQSRRSTALSSLYSNVSGVDEEFKINFKILHVNTYSECIWENQVDDQNGK